MMTYSLSFEVSTRLTKAMKDLHSDLQSALYDIQNASEDERSWLRRWSMISSVGASTRIENAVLTDAEIEWVDTTLSTDETPQAFEIHKENILGKLSKDRERSLDEVVGCRELLSIIYLQAMDMFPLTESSLRGLHYNLLRFYPVADHYAGKYKHTTNQVISMNHDTGIKRVVLDPTPPGVQTEVAMTDLLDWYNGVLRGHPWPLLVASEFVFRFLAIHPFQDGNGRLGRAIFILALLQSDDYILHEIVPFISIDRQIERNRAMYYNVLHQASKGHYCSDPKKYDLEVIAWFFLKMMKAALEDIRVLRTRYSALQGLSESALKVLACFKGSPEKRLTLSELIEETGLVRRTIQNALVTLRNGNFIQQLGKNRGTRYQLVF